MQPFASGWKGLVRGKRTGLGTTLRLVMKWAGGEHPMALQAGLGLKHLATTEPTMCNGAFCSGVRNPHGNEDWGGVPPSLSPRGAKWLEPSQ